MDLAEGIRKHGFRKWYERELLRSHAHMLLLLLCTIGVLGAFEGSSETGVAPNPLAISISVGLCLAVGLWALRRYLYLLMHAEAAANQAICPRCETYGRLALLQGDDRAPDVVVRCKHCGHEWAIAA